MAFSTPLSFGHLPYILLCKTQGAQTKEAIKLLEQYKQQLKTSDIEGVKEEIGRASCRERV